MLLLPYPLDGRPDMGEYGSAASRAVRVADVAPAGRPDKGEPPDAGSAPIGGSAGIGPFGPADGLT
jgi:hypothetical protein